MAMWEGPELENAPVLFGGWRSLCRHCAAEQAAREGRRKWGVAPGTQIPFNQRWEHVQDVVRHALWLSRELDADVEVAEAAAWLHDICKGDRDHAVAGATAAIRILTNSDFPAAKIEPVADAIRHHEGLYRPEGALPLEPLARAILWDADKLPKLGVRALAFILSTTHAVNKSLAQRHADSREFVTTALRRTVVSMNTEPARHLAERRYHDMVAVLETWAREETETAL